MKFVTLKISENTARSLRQVLGSMINDLTAAIDEPLISFKKRAEEELAKEFPNLAGKKFDGANFDDEVFDRVEERQEIENPSNVLEKSAAQFEEKIKKVWPKKDYKRLENEITLSAKELKREIREARRDKRAIRVAKKEADKMAKELEAKTTLSLFAKTAELQKEIAEKSAKIAEIEKQNAQKLESIESLVPEVEEQKIKNAEQIDLAIKQVEADKVVVDMTKSIEIIENSEGPISAIKGEMPREYTLADIQKAVMDACERRKNKGNDGVMLTKKILDKLGVAKISLLDKSQYEEFLGHVGLIE